VPSGPESIEQRLAQLSPEKREALEKLLREKNASPPAMAIPCREPGSATPLSFGQQRIWILDQLAPGSGLLNETHMMRFSFALNIPALEQSVNEIVRRHEILRTTFQTRDGRPVQVIAPELKVPLEVVELRGYPEPERYGRAIELLGKEGCRSFNLATAPLLRTLLFVIGEGDSLFVFSAPHIVCDGWSLGVFDFELTSLYHAYSHGYSSSLRPLKIQYGDFAVWQRTFLRGPVLEKQLSYWRTRLADLPEMTLHPDRPRPAVQTFRGRHINFSVPRSTYESLNEVARTEGVTLFMTLLAAFKVLLHRLTGADDIVVGAPMTNRPYRETEGLIGFFVNTLVMRTRIKAGQSLREFLHHVRDTVVAAFAHQDLPFEKVVEELHPKRDLARNPLFQVAFQFFTAPSSTGIIPGRLLPMEPVYNDTAKFDLRCDIVLTKDGLVGHFEYSTDLFDESTIRRYIGYFLLLLENVSLLKETAIGDLPMISEDEKRRLLADINDTRTQYPKEASLAELFRKSVQRSPEAPAGQEGGRTLNYGDLDRWSDCICRDLRAAGVSQQDRVAICMPRSLAFVAATIAVLKCGGVYVALDPDTPPARLSHLLTDVQAKAIVVSKADERRWSRQGVPVFSIPGWIVPDSVPAPVLPIETDGSAIAYVMYTSGSTGLSKGVEIPHRAVTRLVINTNYLSVRPSDIVALASNVAFDASTFEIWSALLNGAQLFVLGREEVLSAEELGRSIDSGGISVLFLTTDLCHQHVLARPSMFRNLRVLLFGGSRADAQWVRSMLQAGPPQNLLHVYGPTETTTFACYHRVLDVPPTVSTVPIGRPISNTTAYILDDQLNLVPTGVPGQLYIGGDGLARGYFNSPELTAAKFVQHPFAADPDERLYCTGDLARYLTDGTIEFIGRVDQQVKLRGFRIEPGEIEACLHDSGDVQNSVVLPVGEPPDIRLIAYVVPRSRRAQGFSEPVHPVEHWRMIYDSIVYKSPAFSGGRSDPTFNDAGWTTSTYDQITLQEMHEQVDGTVERILELRPSRVLEIGCGTGLLLFRVAPTCQAYLGTDFSEVALNYVRSHLASSGCGHVRLLQARADDFLPLGSERFDTIVLNSVVQYFPDIDYLCAILNNALDRLVAGGRIFLGDVRNLALLDALHMYLELQRAAGSLSTSELKQRIQRQRIEEQELIIDPAFFVSFARENPRITGLRIEPKRGRMSNELSAFRYDVALETASRQPKDEPEWIDWRTDLLSLHALRRRLQAPAKLIGLRRIPNARIAEPTMAADLLLGSDPPATVFELREQLGSARLSGVEPEDLISAAEDAGWHVSFDLSQGSPAGSFDAVFSRIEDAGRWMFSAERLTDVQRPHANTPVAHDSEAGLVSALRRYLRRLLPEYMVPSDFVLLDALPLTANGKVDKNALPVPKRRRMETERAFVAPRTALEQVLCGLCCETLQVNSVGLDDSFFDLGGHSLLATQLVSRIRDTLEIELPLRRLFETLTVARLAESILRDCRDPVFLNRRAELLIRISNMSDEDVEEKLSAATRSKPQ
jgi:amino acid adenylation domain-containing protein